MNRMLPAGSYPIEDFLEAITAQLDKTQDALRLKAVNRPLTFALKDFSLDLQVFVEMDEEGLVRFRPSVANQSGASTVTIGFTTITRSMIDENTVSLELTQSPSLEEVGLNRREQQRLEKLGVRNAAQLRRLEARAGDGTLSRLAGVNIDKLRQALQRGRPRIDLVNPVVGAEAPESAKPSTPPARADDDARPARERLRVAPGVRKIRLRGGNLIDQGRAPEVRLGERRLHLAKASEDEVQVELPPGAGSGVLSVMLPDGEEKEFDLVIDESYGATLPDPKDPWMPEAGQP